MKSLVTRYCTYCNKKFSVRNSKIKEGDGKFCSKSCSTTLRNLINNPTKKGSEHYAWKGDGVGYRTLHKWVEKELGRPCHCEICKNDNLRPRQYHWANVSHNYKRLTNDWRRLCVKCHKAYDRVKSD